jgi:hypothetical protein
VLGPDGISDFEALHAGKSNAEVRLYAFDLLREIGSRSRTQPRFVRQACDERGGAQTSHRLYTLRPGPKTPQRQFSRSTGAVT